MRRDILPLYGPDSGMPSVVETQDPERFCDPGTLGQESCRQNDAINNIIQYKM